MNLKRVTLDDTEIIRPFLEKRSSRLSDFSIGGLIMWRDYLQLEYAVEEDSLFFKAVFPNEEPSFSLPFGGDEDANIGKIQKYCKENDLRPFFFAISSKEKESLEGRYTVLSAVKDRNSFDYLYDSEDIRTFPGRKFHGQKNHINKFIKTYPEYWFEEINEGNLHEALSFFEKYAENDHKTSIFATEERAKVFEVLNNYTSYGFFGIILKISGRTVSMSLGDTVGDTLFVQIEKADKSVPGAYQMIVNEFAKRYSDEKIRYINRGDDAGDEGLRESKLSYHPIEIMEKYTVLLGNRKN